MFVALRYAADNKELHGGHKGVGDQGDGIVGLGDGSEVYAKNGKQDRLSCGNY
jgi:hypothetical protein